MLIGRNGTNLEVHNIADNGERRLVSFEKKTITWIKIDITGRPNSINNGFELVKFERR